MGETLSDLYPRADSDGGVRTQDQNAAPTLAPGADLRTLYAPPVVETRPAQPNPLTTSYSRLPTNEFSGSFEAPGVTSEGMTGLAGAASDAITGNSVKHPELGTLNMPGLGLGVTDPKAWGIVGQTALSRDPAELARVIKARLPEAKIDWDEKTDQGAPATGANLTVQVPGGPQMYLDRPGFTPQKAVHYGLQAAIAALTGGKSLPAQMGLGGLQYGVDRLGSYGLGGAETPVDPVGTAIATLMPGALGTAGAGLIKGYDWLNSETSSSAAAIADRARALYRFGFAGKTGDILNDPARLSAEDIAANSGSDTARATMKAFHDANATKNLDNKRQITGVLANDVKPGEEVAPGYTPTESQFGDRLNQSVRNRADAVIDTARRKWDEMGNLSPSTEAGRSLQFSPEVSSGILGDHAITMNKFFGEPQGADGTHTALQLGDTGKLASDAYQRIKQIMLPAGEDGTPETVQGFNLGHLQDMRQALGNIISDKPGTAASKAAAQMLRQIDARTSAAELTPGQIIGNPDRLTQFRDANAATRAKYDFLEPRDNPAAEQFIANVTNPAAPSTGQETINHVFGGTGGLVTPGGGTNQMIVHLKGHLGNEATDPLSGALGMRSLYGGKGTSEVGDMAPPQFDYTSTSNRIGAQLGGMGGDVTKSLLAPGARDMLSNYRDALDVLSASTKAGPRLNASGTGYVNMMTQKLPAGIGPLVKDIQSTRVARNATQGGAEIVKRAAAGANDAAGLQIRLPRQSTLPPVDPQNPFHSWQPEAWRAGTPLYRAGGAVTPGLLGY